MISHADAACRAFLVAALARLADAADAAGDTQTAAQARAAIDPALAGDTGPAWAAGDAADPEGDAEATDEHPLAWHGACVVGAAEATDRGDAEAAASASGADDAGWR